MVARRLQPVLEERRLRAAEMLVQCMSPKDVAKSLGVTHQAVRLWTQQLAAHGTQGLRSRDLGKLTRVQRDELKHVLAKPPSQSQLRWTCRLVAQYIKQRYGASYTVSGVLALLHTLDLDVDKINFSPPHAEFAPTAQQLAAAESLGLHALGRSRRDLASLIERTLRFRSRDRIERLGIAVGDRVRWSAVLPEPSGRPAERDGVGTVASIHPSYPLLLEDGSCPWALEVGAIVNKGHPVLGTEDSPGSPRS